MSEYSMENKKKILFVIPEYIHGGTNKTLENLLALPCMELYDISIYVLYEDGPDYYKDKFRSLVLKKSLLYVLVHDNFLTRKIWGLWCKLNHAANFNWLYKYEARKIQEKFDFDIVVGFQEGAAIEFANKFHSSKIIGWMHGFNKRISEPSVNSEYKRCYNDVKNIVCVSKVLADYVSKNIPELASKICVIHNSLNVEGIVESSKELSSEEIGYDKGKFNIVSVGRLDCVKNFHRIPEILHNLSAKTDISNIRWYVIGSVFSQDYEERLINETIRYGLEKQIVLLGEKNNPYPYIKNADLYVSLSEYETFSYVINEALVLGTPVLSTPLPVIKEVIPDDCILTAELHDVASVLHRLITNKSGEYASLKKRLQSYTYNNSPISSKIEILFKE